MSQSQLAEFITLAEARYLSLVAQALEHPGSRAQEFPSKSELLDVIRDTGCIQLDSISVVSRAHETAIWSRLGNYSRADLSALHHPDARLIEYWAHAASLLPVEFFPYLRRQMASYANPEGTWYGSWALHNHTLLDQVLETIREQGPLSTRAFARPDGVERTPWAWYGGKPAKQALDCLWTTGELIVLRRAGFERIYELTDRAMPDARLGPLPSMDEQNRFFTRRALKAIGVGTITWISDYFKAGSSRYVSSNDAAHCLEIFEREGSAIRVAIEQQKNTGWLDASLAPVLEAFRAGKIGPRARTLLSPFDNLLWRRDRARSLFGFDYLLESYTPEPKRVYGYYTLPVLIDGVLAGRLDPRYRRKESILSIQSIHLEPSLPPSAELAAAMTSILRRFADFLGGGDIEILETYPPALLPLLRRRLA